MGRSFSDTEPPPHQGQVDVWPLVMADVRSEFGASSLRDRFLFEAEQRDQTGRAKYGMPLQTHNGRNPLVDAFQEAMDLTVYLRDAAERGYPVWTLYHTARSLAFSVLAQMLAHGL